MSGKMNWDRVRKESLVRSHGSAWVPSVVELDRWGRKKKKGKKKRNARGLIVHSPMPGCSCAKPIGFKGQHKAKCSLRNIESKIQHVDTTAPAASLRASNPEPAPVQNKPGHEVLTFSDLVIRLNRVRLDTDLKNLLALWKKRLASDRVSAPFDKDLASQAIGALNAELDKYSRRIDRRIGAGSPPGD